MEVKEFLWRNATLILLQRNFLLWELKWKIICSWRLSRSETAALGKDNDPTEWWNVNDFKILSAAIDMSGNVLKNCSTYFPRVQELDDTVFQNYAPLLENLRRQVQ